MRLGAAKFWLRWRLLAKLQWAKRLINLLQEFLSLVHQERMGVLSDNSWLEINSHVWVRNKLMCDAWTSIRFYSPKSWTIWLIAFEKFNCDQFLRVALLFKLLNLWSNEKRPYFLVIWLLIKWNSREQNTFFSPEMKYFQKLVTSLILLAR